MVSDTVLACVSEEDLYRIKRKVIVGIDGSTSNSGITLLDASSGVFLSSISLARGSDESAVRYKVEFKKFLTRIMENLNIDTIFYEQPFLSTSFTNANTVKALFMLRSSIEEIKIENEPKFDNIQHIEVPNTKWKSAILGKVPTGTDKQKKAVQDYILDSLPMLEPLTEDEFDSTGIAFAGFRSKSTGSVHVLEAKKKYRPFSYNVEFIGAEDDEEFIDDYMDNVYHYKIPKQVLENGVTLIEISGRGLFDNHVYDCMADDDKVIILKFSSKHHSNVVLQYRLASIAQSPYIYAIIWRKSRHTKRS